MKQKYIINDGDILISWSASIGSYVWDRGEAYLNQHIFKVDFNKENVNINKYFFKNMVDIALIRAEKYMHGSTMKHITKKYFDDIKIPVPPLPIQQQIVEMLDAAKQLIDKRKEQIDLLDKLTESIFYEMFGDPIKNEKGWEVMKLSCASECLVPARDKPKSFTGSIPWITINDLVPSGYTNLSKNGMGLTIEEIRNVKRKTIPVGCVLMSCVGDIGITSINSIEVVINQQIHAFDCKENLNSIYLKYYIPKRVDYFSRASNSTTVKYLNKTKCENIPLLLPPLSLQNEFASKVEKIEAQKELLEKSLKLMEDNYNNLMQRAFKGELFDINIC